MKINHFLLSIILIFSSIYLVACSDTPRSSQFHDALLEIVDNEEYQGIFMIRNIKKVNGYMLEDFYYAVMQYDRLSLVDIDDAILMLDQDVHARKSHDLFDELSKGLHTLASQTGLLKAGLVERFGEFKKGDVIKETITIKFLKTEQGWRLYTKKTKIK
ncbi:MAG: hypothetical protein ACC653_08965 [Gammaproteobacteria bacterium]